MFRSKQAFLIPILALLSATLLAACASGGPRVLSPAPAATALNSPLASPLGTPFPTVTADPTMGAVVGVLKVKADGVDKPVGGVILYLGATVTDGSGKKTGVAFDRINDVKALTDREGRFVFRNVKPGEYGLILDTVRDAYMLRGPGDNSDLLVTVKSGETQDMGTLVYDILPVTPMP